VYETKRLLIIQTQRKLSRMIDHTTQSSTTLFTHD